MVTFNVTSRTPSSALDDSEPSLLLFNRGPGAVLVGVTEIFDRAQATVLQPRRAARLEVTEGRITVVPAAGSYALLDVVIEAQRTLSSECASVRADRPVEPGAWGCRFAWFRRVAARLHRKSVDAGQELAAGDALRAVPDTIDGTAPLPIPVTCPVTLDELLSED